MSFRSACLVVFALIAGCAAPDALKPAGTARVAPAPLILISIDGFRADYLARGVSPTLSALAAEGVRAEGMQPSFPSLTFPNHYTIVTGDYPDHHGIVDNAMFDPVLGKFTLGKREAVGDGRWWDQAEPIWVSADRQGVRTATMFWPGSEASIHGYRPDYWVPYEGDTTYDSRVDQVLHWLDLPPSQRPGFLTLYFEAVDTAGHYEGPDAAETNAAIGEVDAALARLVDGLRQRGLLDRVNLIVLSDHGMAATPPDQRIFLDELIDPGYAQACPPGRSLASFQCLVTKARSVGHCWPRTLTWPAGTKAMFRHDCTMGGIRGCRRCCAWRSPVGSSPTIAPRPCIMASRFLASTASTTPIRRCGRFLWPTVPHSASTSPCRSFRMSTSTR